nr:MAG TPA: hypothetical protein [Bacteriophage sp.]
MYIYHRNLTMYYSIYKTASCIIFFLTSYTNTMFSFCSILTSTSNY